MLTYLLVAFNGRLKVDFITHTGHLKDTEKNTVCLY